MKVPLGGKPDFTEISEKQMLEFIDKIQHVSFAYQGVNEKIVNMMEIILNDLHNEVTNRLVKAPFVDCDPVVYDHPKKVVVEKPVAKEVPITLVPKLRSMKHLIKKLK